MSVVDGTDTGSVTTPGAEAPAGDTPGTEWEAMTQHFAKLEAEPEAEATVTPVPEPAQPGWAGPTEAEWNETRNTIYELAAQQQAAWEEEQTAELLDPYAPDYLDNLAGMLEARDQAVAARLDVMATEMERARVSESELLVERLLDEHGVQAEDRDRVRDWAGAEFQALLEAFPDADPRVAAAAAIAHSAELLPAESEGDAIRRVFGGADEEEWDA